MRHGNSLSHKKSLGGFSERAPKLNFNEIVPKCPSKISLSADFLVEMLNCLYFTINNGQAEVGMIVLDEIHNRAIANLYGNVLLVCIRVYIVKFGLIGFFPYFLDVKRYEELI